MKKLSYLFAGLGLFFAGLACLIVALKYQPGVQAPAEQEEKTLEEQYSEMLTTPLFESPLLELPDQ